MVDLPELADFLVNKIGKQQKRELRITDGAIRRLMGYHWPGNVRELKNVAERVILSNLPENDRLSAAMTRTGDLSQPLAKEASLDEQLQHFERQVIQNALKRHKGKISMVMEELDVPRRTLNSKMQRLGIMRLEDSKPDAV